MVAPDKSYKRELAFSLSRQYLGRQTDIVKLLWVSFHIHRRSYIADTGGRSLMLNLERLRVRSFLETFKTRVFGSFLRTVPLCRISGDVQLERCTQSGHLMNTQIIQDPTPEQGLIQGQEKKKAMALKIFRPLQCSVMDEVSKQRPTDRLRCKTRWKGL